MSEYEYIVKVTDWQATHVYRTCCYLGESQSVEEGPQTWPMSVWKLSLDPHSRYDRWKIPV